MKLLTLRSNDRYHPAVLIADYALDLILARGVIELARCLPDNMKSLIAAGPEALNVIERVVSIAKDPDVRESLLKIGGFAAFADVTLGPVVPDPDLILSGSMNSHGHLREMGDAPAVHPCAFQKVRSALSASGAPIVPPPGHGDMVDWEGELCVVIGARCHAVSVAEAQDYIVGYTLMNDVSAREYVLPFVQSKGPVPSAQAWERNVLGKNYPTFCPVGPVIVTKDEFQYPLTYVLETLVNGEIMQSSTQDDLVFGPEQMVSYFSQFYVFQPGDIISMGSPPGVGMAQKPPRFLRGGDLVEVRMNRIGSLVNAVSAKDNHA
jgi:acylpyruvate hydrolase